MKANTDEIIACGRRITELSDDVNKLFLEAYSTINELFTKGYWQGISAKKYETDIKKDLEEFKKFYEILKSYGNILSSSGKELQNIARKYQSYEKNIY